MEYTYLWYDWPDNVTGEDRRGGNGGATELIVDVEGNWFWRDFFKLSILDIIRGTS